MPFSAWELPEQSARWCLDVAGIGPQDLDAVAYSYDPALVQPDLDGLDKGWEHLRPPCPALLATALPGLDPAIVQFVAHHVAHAASAGLAAPFRDSAVLVADGRGGHVVSRRGELDVLASQELPHSLGLMYEEVTDHLGFLRSSDEYKVMALASYGRAGLS